MIKILIVDDHDLVRLGLKTLLDRQTGFQVVGEAGSAQEAVEKAQLLAPDVVIMDIRMPEMDGIAACREIKEQNPHTRVIMLTSYADDDEIFASIMAGASAYLMKQSHNEELVRAVERVSRGESLLDPAITSKVLSRIRGMVENNQPRAQVLNEQESRILDLIARGLTNRQIAQELFLSEGTVRNYVSGILAKLRLKNRSEAAAYAARKSYDNRQDLR